MPAISAETSKNTLRKADPELTMQDVVEIVQLFNQNHIECYIDGGWGVGVEMPVEYEGFELHQGGI